MKKTSKYALDDVIRRATKGEKPFATETKILYHGEVISNDDPLKASRLKVFIKDIDNHIEDRKTLPWCVPLLPTNIQLLPLVGERVWIILEHPWSPTSGRLWIGPYFSQNITSGQTYSDSIKKSGF